MAKTHSEIAEQLLKEAENLRRSPSHPDLRYRTREGIAKIKAELLMRAQVHATLAGVQRGNGE